MCKKQTSVSHSSTESEIISLDTGLRLDGLLALELWDLIVSVFGNISRVSDRSGQPDNDVRKHHKSQKKINGMENIDSDPSNVQSSLQEALLYVFEDNEAVIKMIIKGRSPTMRHVSRTHRVAWLVVWSNWKMQVKYIDTKSQLGWYPNWRKFHTWWVESFVVLVQYQPFQFYSVLWTMAKRSQHDSGEERVTAKSRPMMRLIASLPSHVSSSTSVSPVKRSYGNQYPWTTIAEKKETIRETWYRHRPNESFRLLLPWAIHGKLLFSKLLKVGWWPCLVFSRVENWYWDVRAIGANRWNFLENDTRNSTWFLSRGTPSWRNRAIRCEWGNASWQTRETRYRFSRSGIAFHGLNNSSLETMKQNWNCQ